MNVAEILISAKENLAGLQRVKNELKALGTTAQDTAKRTELANRLMTLGVEPARAINMVAKSWVDVENKVQGATRSLQQGQQAASGLSQLLGVQLPQAATRFLASSQTIGPILAGAFSAVGVLALIQALGQLPALFNKITGAITGWDEASKKAYANFIEDNKKAVEAATAFQAKMAELSGGKGAGLDVEIKAQVEANQRNLGIITQINEALRVREKLAEDIARAGGGFSPAQLSAEEAGQLKTAQDAAIAGGTKLLALQRQQTEETAKTGIEATKAAASLRGQLLQLNTSYQTWLNTLSQEFRTKGAVSIGNDIAAGLDVADRAAKKLIDDFREITKLREDYKKFFDSALQDLRTKGMVSGGEDIAAGLKVNDRIADTIIKKHEDMVRVSEQFIQNFRDGAGRVWDDFFIKGQNILTSLTNLMKGLLNTIGRTLFQNFATGLLTGAKGGGGGGIGGAVGSLGAGLGMKTGLGALFGGGAAGTTVAGGATLSSLGGGAVGISGALGLGGGAGLLGLGAATIPVVGGIIAAGIFAYMKLRHRTEEAPFTKDPFADERRRTIFFFTNMTEAMNRFTQAVDQFGTMSPGVLVKNGMPQALQSNTFRRDTASVFMDDI